MPLDIVKFDLINASSSGTAVRTVAYGDASNVLLNNVLKNTSAKDGLAIIEYSSFDASSAQSLNMHLYASHNNGDSWAHHSTVVAGASTAGVVAVPVSNLAPFMKLGYNVDLGYVTFRGFLILYEE